MGMMIIRHKVSDYGKWRPQFDLHLYDKGGFSNRGVCSADDKNEIVAPFLTPPIREGQGVCDILEPQGCDDKSRCH